MWIEESRQRDVIYLVFGLVMGIGGLLVGGASPRQRDDGELLVSPGQFADVTVRVVDDEETGAMLVVSKQERPFLYVYQNESGTAESFGICDGTDALIGLCEFSEGRIGNVGIFGNAVHAETRTPVFSFKASESPGVWKKATYSATRASIHEGEDTEVYIPSGEVYEDIDFDGQFDVRMEMDGDFAVAYQAIYFQGDWQVIGESTGNPGAQVFGYYDPNSLEAVTRTRLSNSKTRYRFVRGRGWQREE